MPGSAAHAAPVDRAHGHTAGLPVLLLSSSFVHAIVTTPAQSMGAVFAHFPTDDNLPRVRAGSACALLFSRPARRSLALRPARSPSPLRTFYTEGFIRFVTSTTAPIATGRSESCRVGFAPAGRQRLFTAHPMASASAGLESNGFFSNRRSHCSRMSCRSVANEQHVGQFRRVRRLPLDHRPNRQGHLVHHRLAQCRQRGFSAPAPLPPPAAAPFPSSSPPALSSLGQQKSLAQTDGW
jgi:hypothetical protein